MIRFTDNQKNDIVHKYKNGLHASQICVDYHTSVTPIYRILREQKVPRRSPIETSRKYHFDEHYFDYIDISNKSYFLGLLMADGYNSDASIVLILNNRDRDIVEKFRDDIAPQKNLRYFKSENGSDLCGLELCSLYLSHQLSSLGCVRAKTFTLQFPTYLSGDLVRHFMRGYFDGDGCLSYTFAKRNNYFGNSFLSVVTFTSTENFCLYVKEYLKNNLNIHSTMLCRHPSHKNNIRTLQVSGNCQVIKLMKWLYKDTDLFMKRKYDKFLEIQNILKSRNEIVSRLRAENGRKIMNIINSCSS